MKEDKSGESTEVKVIAHSRNRDDTYAAMRRSKGKYTYHFYTGKIPKKGYAVAFYGKIYHGNGVMGDVLSYLPYFHLPVPYIPWPRPHQGTPCP